jgi:hypothetical protein
MSKHTMRWGVTGLFAVATVAGCSSAKDVAGAGNVAGAHRAPSSTASIAARQAALQSSKPHCLTAAQAFAIVTTLTGPDVVLDSDHGYACAGGWAYVNYRQVPYGNQATKALQYVNGTWVIGDRLLGCGDSTHPAAMPPAIAAWGCGN